VERKPMGLLTLMRMTVIKMNIIRITVRYGKSRYIFAKVQVIVKVLGLQIVKPSREKL
jgi:hypothetical protein